MLGAGALIEREKVGLALVIAEQNEAALIEERRAAVSPQNLERPELGAEVALPDQLSIHVERDKLPVAHPGVDQVPVGDAARAGEVVLDMDARRLPFEREFVLPFELPCQARKRLDDELGF